MECFLIFKHLSLFLNYVSVCGYEHMSALLSAVRRRCQISLELELQGFVSHSTWVLGTKISRAYS